MPVSTQPVSNQPAATTPVSDPTVPDLSSYRAIHTALHAPYRLARAVRSVDVEDPAQKARIRAMGRYWARFATEVHLHHTLEDEVFFPALVERHWHAAKLIVRTDADHEMLDWLMARSSAGFEAVDYEALAPTLDELARHMEAHLDFEDAEILPLFEQRFTHDEFVKLEDVAVKSTGLGRQAAFTVPFVLSSLPEQEFGHLEETAPVALRVLYRLTKKRHARLDRLVFDDPDREPAPLPQRRG